MFKSILPLCFLILTTISCLPAQVVTTDPPFPNENSRLTVFFDATQGTGGLKDCNCDVYVHTGVLTNKSTGPSDWKYVKTQWGVANPAWRMTPVVGNPNRYQFTLAPTIRTYFGVPAGEEILKVNFVFRNANGTLEGKETGGQDIFVDVYPVDLPFTAIFQNPTDTFFSIALGRPIGIKAAASASAQLALYEETQLLLQSTGTSLEYTLVPTQAGIRRVELVARAGSDQVVRSFRYEASLQTNFDTPTSSVLFVQLGDTIPIRATSYIDADLSLLEDGQILAQAAGNQLEYRLPVDKTGAHRIEFVAEYQGQTASSVFAYVIPEETDVADPPAGFLPGINLMGDTGMLLQLYAPGKTNIFVIGDFNDWIPATGYQMKKSQDGNIFWLQIDRLDPGRPYAFQYLVDGDLRIADPYSTLVLDPVHDPFIPEITYPDLPAYPKGKTTGIASLVHPGAPAYEWAVNDFVAPPKEKLVVYELLLRDFLDRHDYTTLIDTLDYLARLGVNAIELMPVNEFEGNISWGYNPSFHMALDKYYGTINEFKRFVDTCHARGIAVLLDVVYNHAFSQSPLAQLYWDAANFRPAAGNPWLNPVPRHPFNVGYDFNHQSTATRTFVDRVLQYWLEEFRVDGFRFDLSKGFTQVFSTDDGVFRRYEPARIATLKHYADVCWSVNPGAYVILEHFAEGSEEKELSDYGMMLWGGFDIHNNYLEAAMGFNANLSLASFKLRNWNDPHLVAYMESHDEERMMYKNLQFGNSSGGYSVKDFNTSLQRIALASTFFYPVPGPKMLWQFGELGYDFPINYCPNGSVSDGCRTDPKPIRWDYRDDPDRFQLYQIIRSLIHLKTNYEVFSTTDFTFNSPTSKARSIHLKHPTMNVAIQGNFDVVSQNIPLPFPNVGWWYEYFTGDSILINSALTTVTLQPGEYRLYTSVRIQPPVDLSTATREVIDPVFQLTVFPNPSTGMTHIRYELEETSPVRLELYNAMGQQIGILQNRRQPAGEHLLALERQLPPGAYWIKLTVGNRVESERLMVVE